MRKNTEKVIRAWENDRPERSSASIWTDGANIWSYQTCILAAIERNEPASVLNVTRYSATTKLQQNAIRVELARCIRATVDGLEKEAKPEDILARAGMLRAEVSA